MRLMSSFFGRIRSFAGDFSGSAKFPPVLFSLVGIRRDPGEPGAHTMTPSEVLSVAQAGEKLGCTEALFSLGDRPEALFPEMRETLGKLGYRSTLHYLEAMCELVLRETRLLPHANPGLLRDR